MGRHADHPPAGVQVLAAPGSGDDAVVAAVQDSMQGTVQDSMHDSMLDAAVSPVLVVTADLALAARCEALGATVVGPRWLISLTDEG